MASPPRSDHVNRSFGDASKKAPARPNLVFNPKYEYPEVLPPYVPPRDKKPAQLSRVGAKSYIEDESYSSRTETESDQADDEFLGQFTSNHEFLCSSNQIKQSRCEGNAQIQKTSHQRQFEYRGLVEELCDLSQKSSCNNSSNNSQRMLDSFDKSLSQKALEKSYILDEVNELKEKLYFNETQHKHAKPETVQLISAISLKKIEAFFEVVKIESNEHVVDYEVPATSKGPKPKKSKPKTKKKPQGFGKYSTTHKASEDEADEPVKQLLIMRATKTLQVQEQQLNSDKQKSKAKVNKVDDVKINEFIKTVITGGRTTDESENEGWQRTNLCKKPEPEEKKTKKKGSAALSSQKEPTKEPLKEQPKSKPSEPKPTELLKQSSEQPKQQQFQPKPSNNNPSLQKSQSAAQSVNPVFQHTASKGDNIWAQLEIVGGKNATLSTDVPANQANQAKAKKQGASIQPTKIEPVIPQPVQANQPAPSNGQKKKKKKNNQASNEAKAGFMQADQQFNALQKASFDLLSVLQMNEESKDNPFLLETLASKIAQLYPIPMQQQQQLQPEETKTVHLIAEPTSPGQSLTDDEMKFHEMVSAQVCQIVKNFEYKLDSVRKEREAAIAIIDRCVKQVFERQTSSRAPIIPVSIKQYGSQASHLAVDSSDVDLAVTGLKLNGDQDVQINEMRRLFSYLDQIRSEGFIIKLDLIETASVPLIKVQIDLQVIQEITRKKALQQAMLEGESIFVPDFVLLDESMVILHVDIIFDDYNPAMTLENPQSGIPSSASPYSQTSLIRQNFVPSASLAITSVHKIKELQLKYTDLRNIVLIVKKLLAKHNLHKPYTGGLNSYSIVLMTSTFLQKFGINHKSALSQNLSEFLKFFGNYFDPTVLGMDGYKFFNLSAAQREAQEHLIVLDIQNPTNNTARSAFRIMEAKRVFSDAYRTIIENLHKFEAAKTPEARMKINVIKQLIY